jgi:phage RecT family recombinase
VTEKKQTSVTTRDPNAVNVLLNTIQHRDMQEVLRKTLPDGVSLERFTQATVAALKHNPDVFLECDRNSVYNAIVQAAKDGLLPDGRHGALAPFNTKQPDGSYVKKCQFLIMPEGIIDKLAKLGIAVYAVSVYAGDRIRIWNDDTGQHVEHEPNTFRERGERIGAYACARILKSGQTYVEAMNQADLEAPRRVTKAKDKNGELYGPWKDFPERMEQKTCLHRICKRLPNIELPDDEEFSPENRPMVTIDAPVATAPPPAEKPTRPAALQRVVDSQPMPPPAEEPPPLEEPF